MTHSEALRALPGDNSGQKDLFMQKWNVAVAARPLRTAAGCAEGRAVMTLNTIAIGALLCFGMYGLLALLLRKQPPQQRTEL